MLQINEQTKLFECNELLVEEDQFQSDKFLEVDEQIFTFRKKKIGGWTVLKKRNKRTQYSKRLDLKRHPAQAAIAAANQVLQESQTDDWVYSLVTNEHNNKSPTAGNLIFKVIWNYHYYW